MENKENIREVKRYCRYCGKRLPVNVLNGCEDMRIEVLCRHCKQKNIIEK